MITPKYHQLISNQSKRISHLIKDLEKSKLAVESIPKFSAADGKFKQQINIVQEQLQNCILNIAIQAKKNKVLSELVGFLQGDVQSLEILKKKQEETEDNKKEKLMGKYQYEIDQILQKHNEEIAKIHNLKDLANSSRSERVVYSSLFKKLQKEIKHFQEIYKEQLMFSQFAQVNKNVKPTEYKNSVFNWNKDQGGYELGENGSSKYRDQLQLTLEAPWNGFLTIKQNSSSKQPATKRNQILGQQEPIKGTNSREEKFQHTKDLLRKIADYNNLIDKIKSHCECTSVEETFQFYSTIQEENEELLQKITKCDKSLEEILQKTEKIKKRTYQQNLANTIEEDEDTFTKHKSMKLGDAFEESSIVNEQLFLIAEICGVNLKQNNLESLKQLDEKIQLISKEGKKITLQSNCKQRAFTTHDDPVVEVLLEKMQKFTNCEKIMERGLLQQEYYKQIERKNISKIKKDTVPR